MAAKAGKATASSRRIVERASRAGGFKPDARGLMPLAAARAVFKRRVVISTPTDKDLHARALQQWAALLSLEGADEALAALYAITWNGWAGTTYPAQLLVDRYGPEPVLKFLGSCFGMFNVLHSPWEKTLDMLRKVGSEEAFEVGFFIANTTSTLMFRADRKQSIAALTSKGMSKEAFHDGWRMDFAREHPDAALAVLRRHAANKDKRAQAMLHVLDPGSAKPSAPATAEAAILAVLDEAASGFDWPLFDTGIEDDPDVMEYFELRLIAVYSKSSDAWGIAFERLSGSYDPWDPTSVYRYLYGSAIASPGRNTDHDVPAKFVLEREPKKEDSETLPLACDGETVRGPAGPLKLVEKALAKRDLKPGLGSEYEGDAGYNHRLRAYVDAHPGVFFTPAKAVIKLLGVKGPVIVCDTTAFAHATGKHGRKGTWRVVPSKSETYRSLAKAILTRNAAAFAPGTSNIDFRLHATHKLR